MNKIYLIYNVNDKEFIFKYPGYREGRKYLIYGDKRSATIMKNSLMKWDFKDKELKVVEYIPKIEDCENENNDSIDKKLEILKQRQDLIMYLIQALFLKLGSSKEELSYIVDTINGFYENGEINGENNQ